MLLRVGRSLGCGGLLHHWLSDLLSRQNEIEAIIPLLIIGTKNRRRMKCLRADHFLSVNFQLRHAAERRQAVISLGVARDGKGLHPVILIRPRPAGNLDFVRADQATGVINEIRTRRPPMPPR